MKHEKKYAELNNRELSALSSQIAMLIKSGISVREGLDMIGSDLKDSRGKELIGVVAQIMDDHHTFSSALKQTQAFPKYMVDMVKVGEVTGHLDDVMASLALHFNHEHELRESIKSAIRYPLVMVGMMLVVLLVIIIKVLPVFQQVFQQLGVSMSGISKGLLNFGEWMTRDAVGIIVVLVVFILLGLWMTVSQKGILVRKKVLAFFPGTKAVYQKIQQARFVSTLSLAISSGINSKQALEMIAEITESKEIQKKLRQSIILLEEGENTQNALTNSELFSGLEARMVAIGFQTGNADVVMRQLAKQMAEEADEEISRKVGRIEPTVVAFFSIIVGIILLSVMLPLMAVMSTIG